MKHAKHALYKAQQARQFFEARQARYFMKYAKHVKHAGTPFSRLRKKHYSPNLYTGNMKMAIDDMILKLNETLRIRTESKLSVYKKV